MDLDLPADGTANVISRNDMGLSVSYSAPRTELERTLAEIWSSVLEVYPIGIEDDFFEHGGDSFASTVVASEIEDKLNVSFLTRPTPNAVCEN